MRLSFALYLSYLTLVYSFSVFSSRILNKAVKMVDLSSLPPGMYSNTPGTWAHDTMSRRIHEDILQRIIDDNADELGQPTANVRAEAFMQLSDLRANLQAGKSGALMPITSGPDCDTWNDLLASIPEAERNWLDAPWLISEYYFYRRIVGIFGYFETFYDPFIRTKVRGLTDALPFIEDLCERIPVLLKDVDKEEWDATMEFDTAVEVAIHTSLWGNKLDLSLWPTSEGGEEECRAGFAGMMEELKSDILDDHTHDVVALLKDNKGKGGRGSVGIVVDNAGFELFSDMFLGHILLSLRCVDTVEYHTKGFPTFVSDATSSDFIETVRFLLNVDRSKYPATASFAEKIEDHLDYGSIALKEDYYWCQPLPFWTMPEHVTERIGKHVLSFVKGDANYRRLLGERQWPLHTPAKAILDYWPGAVCGLRTLKAEIGCGISEEQAERARRQTDDWMVSGRFGVVQLGGGGI